MKINTCSVRTSIYVSTKKMDTHLKTRVKYKNMDSSLTAPLDRTRGSWMPASLAPLSETETFEAQQDLIVKQVYKNVDRVYIDPAISMQNIALVSFIPCKGATPDAQGMYGFAKIRGCFNTILEADQRAEYIIRNVDSYHKIFYTKVGHPFPITTESSYSADHNEVDIRKKVVDEFSSDIKKQKEDDSAQIKQIQEREQALKSDVSKEEVDPYDEYITLKVKNAQLHWTYLEHIKKLKEIKPIIQQTRRVLLDMDRDYPSFKDQYYQKYLDARKEAGLKESPDDKDSFMRFLVEETELDGVDSEYISV